MIEKIKIVLVDDHRLFRNSFSDFLDSFPDLIVVGVVANGEELFHLIEKIQFDIILLDVQMTFGMDGIETLQIANRDFPHLKIIMLSGHEEDVLVNYCLNNGAKGYLSKNSEDEVINNTIKRVHNGEVCHDIAQIRAEIFMDDLYKELSIKYGFIEKELDVLRLMCRGKASKIIADELHLSTRSIERYIETIYKKTRAKSKADMIAFGIRSGIVWK